MNLALYPSKQHSSYLRWAAQKQFIEKIKEPEKQLTSVDEDDIVEIVEETDIIELDTFEKVKRVEVDELKKVKIKRTCHW